MENQPNDNINKYVFNTRKSIMVFTPILGVVFLFFGLLMMQDGDPHATFSVVFGVIFIIIFLISFIFRKKMQNRDIEYYNNHPKIFKFVSLWMAIVNAYFVITLVGVAVMFLLVTAVYFHSSKNNEISNPNPSLEQNVSANVVWMPIKELQALIAKYPYESAEDDPNFSLIDNSVAFTSDSGPKIIDGADLATFEIVTYTSSYGGDHDVSYNTYYARDKNHAYVVCSSDSSLAILNRSEFETVSKNNQATSYAKDKTHVYIQGCPVDLDPTTFVVLEQGYVKDKSKVYWVTAQEGWHLVSGADSKTFQVFSGDYYAKDVSSVYWAGTVIPNADAYTFQALGGRYAKDVSHAYSMNEVILGADPFTFTVLHNAEYAKDKNHVYDNGETVIGLNPESVDLNYDCVEDTNGGCVEE